MSEPIPSCVGERCLIITLIKADILQLYTEKSILRGRKTFSDKKLNFL